MPFEGQGIALSVRVARPAATLMGLVHTLSESSPERAVVVEGVPAYADGVAKGVGAFR
jgi:hypothetical protein